MRISLALLGSVAALATVSPALAADLPTKKAAPVDYVRVCSLGGGKFVGYAVPGTDTCLKVGGFVRYQATYWSPTNQRYYNAAGQPRGATGYGTQTWGQTVTASLKLDARTQTEYGLLRSYADMRIAQGFRANAGGTVEGTGAFVDKAFIEFAGFTAGKYQSFFDFYADAFNNVGTLGSDHKAIGAAYTATIDKFSATLSLEDSTVTLGMPNYYGITSNASTVSSEYYGFSATQAGNRVPDAIVQLLYSDSWGQVQLSGALHQVRANVQWTATKNTVAGLNDTAVNSNDTQYGWAIQGGVKLNVPSLGAGDALYVQAAYADGALLYLGAAGSVFGPVISSGGRVGTAGKATELAYGSDAMIGYGTSGSMKLTQGWNGLAAFQHSFAPTFSASVYGGYTEIDYASATPGRDFHYWQAGLQGNWKPVKNLAVMPSVNYVNVTASAMPRDGAVFSNLKKSSDGIGVALRVQRDF